MEDKSLQSTSPMGAADYFATLTAINLVLIAIGMVAAVAIIVWGWKRWRDNKRAMDKLEAEGRIEHVDDATAAEPEDASPAARVAPEPEDTAPVPVVAPVSEPIPQPIPVSPPPPPIVAPEPATVASIPAVAATPAAPGDLTRLKGLGPKVAAKLEELGVTRIADLAALDEAQAAALDAQLGNFRGRMGRDRWIEQAKLLDAGDITGYEAQFGKLG